MFTPVLFAHSWLRWALLAVTVAVLARAVRAARAKSPFSSADAGWLRAMVIATDVQLLLGLLLYGVLSPTSRAVFATPALMKVSAFRFFAVEHAFAMSLAVVAVHVSAVLCRRAKDDARKHRLVAIGAGVALALFLAGIPWPGLPYGRPLLRF